MEIQAKPVEPSKIQVALIFVGELEEIQQISDALHGSNLSIKKFKEKVKQVVDQLGQQYSETL